MRATDAVATGPRSGRYPAQRHDRADLDWLLEVAGRGEGASIEYLARPSAARPWFLVPVRARPAAAALRRIDDDRSTTDRAIGLAARAAARTGIIGHAPGERIELPALAVVERLALHLGEPALVPAISIGPPRRNRKPVLELITPAGRTAGFAKIGWSPLTSALVEAEAAALETIEHRLPDWIVVPALLGRYRSVAGPVVATTGLPVPTLRDQLRVAWRRRRHRAGGRRGPTDRATELVRAIASVGHQTGRRVGELALWAEWERLGVGAIADLDAIARHHGAVRLDTGLWHGDLTPWNIATGPTATAIWDWEMAAPDRPVGFDRLHQLFERARRAEGGSTRAGLAAMVAGSAPALDALGVTGGPQSGAAVVDLYLCQLIARECRLQGQRWPSGTAPDLVSEAAGLLGSRLR